MVEELPTDDATNLVAELPETDREAVLAEVTDRVDVEYLLAYPEATAGRLMTTQLVAVREEATLREAIDEIRRQSEEDEGLYQVYVVDGLAFGSAEPSPVISYEGLSQVVYDPEKRPIRDLLPDLVALPQQNVTFGPPFEIFDDPVPAGSTCHQSEIDEDNAHTCLRFDQVLGNIGSGALDIRFEQPTGVVPVDGQSIPVDQRIYRSDGKTGRRQ